MTIHLERRRVVRFLIAVSCSLVVAHGVTRALAFELGDDYLYGIGPLFDLDEEANLPTLFSTLSLLFAAAVLACIAAFEKADRSRCLYWSGLSVLFLFMAIDEAAMLHELVGGLIQERFELSGYLYYSWIIPYAIVLVVLFVLYLRFFRSLPGKIRILMLTAGAIYGVGVISLESIAARHDSLYGQETVTFTLLATAEETLEMGAVVVFINALLAYIEARCAGLRVTLAW